MKKDGVLRWPTSVLLVGWYTWYGQWLVSREHVPLRSLACIWFRLEGSSKDFLQHFMESGTVLPSFCRNFSSEINTHFTLYIQCNINADASLDASRGIVLRRDFCWRFNRLTIRGRSGTRPTSSPTESTDCRLHCSGSRRPTWKH